MRNLAVIGLLFSSPSLCFGQSLPPISQLLPQVSVEPPAIIDATDPASRQTARRPAGPFNVRNNSRYDVRDLELRCSYVAGDKILGQHAITIHETFRAGSRRRTAPRMLPPVPAQVRTVKCGAKDGVVVAVGSVDPCPDCPDAALSIPTCDCDLSEPVRFDPGNEGSSGTVRRVRGTARPH
jgi:hypothetical protein